MQGFTFVGRFHCYDTLTPLLISLLRVWILEEFSLPFSGTKPLQKHWPEAEPTTMQDL